MSKQISINGKWFEVIHSKYTQVMIDRHTCDYLGRRDLFDFYENPSASKRIIWREWEDWADGTDYVRDMRVKSANTFTFSIGAYYVNPDTLEIEGYFVITAAHNRLYLLK